MQCHAKRAKNGALPSRTNNRDNMRLSPPLVVYCCCCRCQCSQQLSTIIINIMRVHRAAAQRREATEQAAGKQHGFPSLNHWSGRTCAAVQQLQPPTDSSGSTCPCREQNKGTARAGAGTVAGAGKADVVHVAGGHTADSHGPQQIQQSLAKAEALQPSAEAAGNADISQLR